MIVIIKYLRRIFYEKTAFGGSEDLCASRSVTIEDLETAVDALKRDRAEFRAELEKQVKIGKHLNDLDELDGNPLH